eukprot:gene36886-49754_t
MPKKKMARIDVMIITITPVITVSRRVGQMTLRVSAWTCRMNSIGVVFATLPALTFNTEPGTWDRRPVPPRGTDDDSFPMWNGAGNNPGRGQRQATWDRGEHDADGQGGIRADRGNRFRYRGTAQRGRGQGLCGEGFPVLHPLCQPHRQFAQAAGMPKGVNLWLDLEDIPQGTPATDIIGYANAWIAPVVAAGYVPGVYVGFNVWLTPEQLFFELHTQHYWRADGKIVDVAHRGYQMFQHTSNIGTPQEFDKDVVMYDSLGGAPIWLAPA